MSLVFRLFNLLRGHASHLVSFFERHRPEALLETEREKLRKHIARFNTGLVAHAAVSERLITAVKRGETKANELTRRITALVNAGEREPAARLALELKDAKARLAEERDQLAQSEATYRQLVEARDRAVAEARRKIETVRRDIGDLKVKRAIADLEGMAQAMINTVAGPGDSLDRLHELVTEEREKASARVRVVSGPLDAEEQRLSERERAIMANEALDEFLGDVRSPRLLPDLSNLPAQTVDIIPSFKIKEGE
jgi:phage shock protein A